jgi:rare lipoprotein A
MWNHTGPVTRNLKRVQRDFDAATLVDEDDEAAETRRQPRKRAARQPQPSKKAQRPSTRRSARAADGGRFVRRTSRGTSGGGPSAGVASYYWQPQRVASGGWFNPNAMTAAHKTLPFGTRVRVTHAGTGRSVDVTINDRGPYVRGRVIDLSRAAAGALGMRGAGLARVSVDVIGR